jgi:hypothetical protein
MTAVKTLTRSDGVYKVDIFLRNDGTYGFEEFKWAAEESCWIPFGKYSTAIIDTLERAIQEAESRVRWLQDVTS